MTIIAALASFGATAAGLVGIGTGAVAGTAGVAGASAAALGAGTSAAIGAGTATALGAGVGAIKAAATGEDVGKGALMGAGTGLATAGVGSGLAAGAQAAGMAGAIGTTATNVAVGATTGATVGAGQSAITGGDVGKGALLGGATGAVAAGAGSLASGAMGTGAVPTEVAPTELGAGKLAGPDIATGTAGTTTNALPELSKLGADVPIGTNTTPMAPSNLGGAVTGAIAGGGVNYTGSQMIDSQAAASKAAGEDALRAGTFANQNQAGMNRVQGLGLGSSSGPLSALGSIGRATGGLTALAHGGQVPLKDGAYIIPADVVSALGNGSSKAGAEFLRHLMMEVRKESVNIQGLGAAKKHVA